MPQDPFPDCGDDGEEPDDFRPLPADDGVPEGPEHGLFMCLPAEELTLSGFAQNGRADTMAPGALLATLLDAITGEGGSGLAGLADDQLIGIISAARRMESRIAWTLMSGLAELARRRPPTGPCDSGQDGFSDFAPDEIAAELHLTNQSAAGQMAYACGVEERLPRCFAALFAGRIHAVHLRIIEDETALLSPEHAAAADAQLAELAPSLTFGRLRAVAHRLVLKLDPDSARRRKEAAKQDAHVRRFREESGNAGMVARELPPDEILASWQHVEQRALDLRAAGLRGTLRELRVRAYLDLLQERDSRLLAADPGTGQVGRPPEPDNADDPWDQDTGPGDHSSGSPGDPGGSGPHPGGPGGPGGSGPRSPGDPSGNGPNGVARQARQARQDGPSVAALVNITVSLGTALGQSETPGEVGGYGLLDARDARDLLAAAARHPHTRWCVTALHPDGTAAAHGCAVGRHPPPGTGGGGQPPGQGPDPPPGTANPTVTNGPSPDPGPDPPPGTAKSAVTGSHLPDRGAPSQDYLASLRVRLVPIARAGCDHTRAETGYRPSRNLAHLVKVRNTRCTAPGCGRPAAQCDLDHTLAWEQGGITCECDLAPLCRHHHRCKQAEGWQLEQPEPGLLVWRTPTGRSYGTTPSVYPA